MTRVMFQGRVVGICTASASGAPMEGRGEVTAVVGLRAEIVAGGPIRVGDPVAGV